MDYQQIIDKYYPEANRLRDILITHSTLVMKRAVLVCERHPELQLNRPFLIEADMLHALCSSREPCSTTSASFAAMRPE